MRFLLLLGLVASFAGVACPASETAEGALRSQRSWQELEAFQGRVSRGFFLDAMNRIYAPTADWERWMQVEENGVWIERGADPGGERLFVAFGAAEAPQAAVGRKGLAGLRVVLDPGHIGGDWGPVEERSFSVGGGPLLQEGDLTLAASRRIAERLREQGAEVLLTREAAEPVTAWRAADFLEEARSRLGAEEGAAALAARLFYRTAEIRARARRIADWGGADLVLAIHVNARGFEDPDHPTLHDGNDAHVLVNGCYLEGELASPEQRLELLLRLFQGYHLEEERWGRALVASVREATGLPPYEYEHGNAAPLDRERYLWCRNLLANRIFDCPVVYLEPWQANGAAVYEWAAAGDYEGAREFAGESRESLPAAYCDFVVSGLLRRFRGER